MNSIRAAPAASRLKHLVAVTHTGGMRAWVGDLRAAWQAERIVLASPMPIEVARYWLFDGQGPAVGDYFRRGGATLNTRTPWRPVLRGRLLPAGSGSTFVGVLGWDPLYRAFTCCLLGAFAAVFVAGVAALASGGRGQSALLIVLGLFGIFAGLLSIVAGYRETREQTAYLRSWITGVMNTPWYPAGDQSRR